MIEKDRKRCDQMELSNYSVRIPEGRELESGEIDIGTRREFSLELGNSGAEPVDAEISICGEDLGTWPVRPGRKTVVELSEHDLSGMKPGVASSAQPAIKVRFMHSRDQEIVIRVRIVSHGLPDSSGTFASVDDDNEAVGQAQSSSSPTAEEKVLLKLRAAISIGFVSRCIGEKYRVFRRKARFIW